MASSSASGSAQYYIGCKISLISKSDIRYEGILYNLDQAASTVALSNVVSFGTEDRRQDQPVPARDQIYEYILFRGSDIKDIVVCEPPRPELFPRRSDAELSDPAILQVTDTAPTSHSQAPLTATRPSPQEFSSQPAALSLHGAAVAGAIGAHVPPNLYSNPTSARPLPRSVTSRQDDRDDRDGAPANQHGGQERRRYGDDGNYGGYREEQRGYSSRGGGGGYTGGGYDDGYSGSSRGGGYRSGGRYVQGQGYGSTRGGGSDYPSSRGGYQARGGYNRGGYQRQDSNEQPRRRNDSHYQNSGASGSQEHGGATSAAQTKALPDYDFETAEKVFHELESQAKKLSLNDHAGERSHENGGQPKKEDNSADEPTKYYDPDSFFDKISCEALEKEKNPGQRPDWKRERQVNSETFGFTGYRSRNFSGGHQGRGGFRGYNRDGGQRSNFQEGGYRSTNQQRGGYGGGASNYDDGNYRPRGGNSTGYPSRNFAQSQRPSQTAGWGRRSSPQEFFRCPDSPVPRRRPQSVHFDDHDYSFEDYEDRVPINRGQSGGRRRRNRGGEAGRPGQRQESDTAHQAPKPPRNGSRGRSDNGQADQEDPQPKRRTYRNRNRGSGGASGSGDSAQSQGMTTASASGNPTGSDRRKQRGGRKKEEWVQYDMPSNCKDLVAHGKSGDGAGVSSSDNGTMNGSAQKETSVLAFLDGEIGQTGVKLDGDGNKDGNVQIEAN